MTVLQQLLVVARRAAHKTWHSPVGMTWLNQFVTFGSALILLPLVLRSFTVTEQAVWLTLNLITMIGTLVEVGVRPVLIRSMAYFWSGAEDIPAGRQPATTLPDNVGPNWDGIRRLYATLRPVYIVLAMLAMVTTAIAGVPLAWNVIHLDGNRIQDWLALLSCCVSTGLAVRTSAPTALLEGMQRVAHANRLAAAIGACRILLSIIVVLSGGRVLALLFVQCMASFVVYHIVNRAALQQLPELHRKKGNFDALLLRRLLPPTLRTAGIGVATFFISQGTGLAAAQLKDAALVTSYLLTLRLLLFGVQVSRAPLYAHLPNLIAFRARSDLAGLRREFLRGLARTMLLLMTVLVGIGVACNPSLELLGSHTRIVDGPVYWLLATWAFLETHHSAHAQAYLTTNHVPFFWPATISGLFIVGGSFLSVRYGWGLLGIVLTPVFVQLACNNWLPVIYNLRSLNWPIKAYATDISWAVFLRLSGRNYA